MASALELDSAVMAASHVPAKMDADGRAARTYGIVPSDSCREA